MDNTKFRIGALRIDTIMNLSRRQYQYNDKKLDLKST